MLRSREALAGLLLSFVLSAPVRGAEREASLADVLGWAETHAPRRELADVRRRLGDAARAGAAPWLPDNPTLELAAGPRLFGSSLDRGLDVTASISLPLALGLQDRRRAAAERTRQRLGAEANAERWTLRREITAAYREGQLARVRLAIAIALVASAEDMLRIVERRRGAGEATAIDARIATGDALVAKQGVSRAREELRLAQLRLCELAGYPPDAPPLPSEALDPVHPPPPVEHAIARAAATNPGAVVARSAIEETRAEVAVADREGWARPAVGVTYAREGAAGGSPASTIVLGTLSVPLPLWQRNQGPRAKARAADDRARAEARLLDRSVAFRVRRAHLALTAAAERLDLHADAIASLTEGLALLRKGFEAGQLPLLDVAVARDRLVQSQAAALAAREDYERARLDLEDVVRGAP